MAASGGVLITGASGFVGQNLALWFAARGQVASAYHRAPLPANIAAITRPVALDICDAGAVGDLIADMRPSLVIHAAGNKSVRECENNPDLADAVNAQGTLNVARACQAVRAHMLYLSTDLVFPCTQGGYTEAAPPQSPLAYGRSKHEGERLAAGVLSELAICRSGGVYGRGSPLLRWVAAELTTGRQVEAFTDVYNTPTYVDDLAEMLARVADRRLAGVFHLVGPQRINRFEFFRTFAEVFELPASRVVPVVAGPRLKDMLLTADASLANAATRARLGGALDTVAAGLRRLRAAGGLT